MRPSQRMRLLLATSLLLSSTAFAAATPTQVAHQLYDALAEHDAAAARPLYAAGARFRDPAFGKLSGGKIGTMWAQTIGKNTGAKLTYEVVRATDDHAIVHWDATYKVFGRPVVNHVTSYLKVTDGQIVKQRDFFSWQKWSRQALPIGGLSRSPLLHSMLSGVFRLSLVGKK